MRQTALISGGMGAVGRAMAAALAQEGYSVALLYRSESREAVDAFLATLPGSNHVALQCDVRDSKAVKDAVSQTEAKLGDIGVCVHTAADPIKRSTIEAMDSGTFREQFESSVFGAFALFSAVLPSVKRAQGLIVGITTNLIEHGQTTSRVPGYIAAKYALRGLLRELAEEAKTAHVRVNAIAPDIMKTKFSSDLPERYFEFAAERDPRGRLTTPEEVADALLYLLSPKGSSVTGSSLVLPDRQWSPL